MTDSKMSSPARNEDDNETCQQQKKQAVTTGDKKNKGLSIKTLVIQHGFPTLHKIVKNKSDSQEEELEHWLCDDQDPGADNTQREPLPKQPFVSYDRAVLPEQREAKQNDDKQDLMELLIQDCIQVSQTSQQDASQEDEQYSTGSTFFLPSCMKPRCALEGLAREIFNFHTSTLPPNCTYNPQQSGAEWWTLCLDHNDKENSKNNEKKATENKKSVTEEEEDEEDDDDDEVGMHFDADYGLQEQSSIMLHPRVATVTYFSNVGVPTLILEQTSPQTSETMKTKKQKASPPSSIPAAAAAPSSKPASSSPPTVSMDISRGWLSFPRLGKHIAFDGRFLHGAPSDFFSVPNNTLSLSSSSSVPSDSCSPPAAKKPRLDENDSKSLEDTTTEQQKRITFMVNIWLNHCPLEPEPLEEEILSQLKTPWPIDCNKNNNKNENNGPTPPADEKLKGHNLFQSCSRQASPDTNKLCKFHPSPKSTSSTTTSATTENNDDKYHHKDEFILFDNHEATLEYTFSWKDSGVQALLKDKDNESCSSLEMQFEQSCCVLRVGLEPMQEEEEEEEDDET